VSTKIIGVNSSYLTLVKFVFLLTNCIGCGNFTIMNIFFLLFFCCCSVGFVVVIYTFFFVFDTF
jgi:hypothetical protein